MYSRYRKIFLYKNKKCLLWGILSKLKQSVMIKKYFRKYLSEFGNCNTDHLNDVGITKISQPCTSVCQQIVSSENGNFVAIFELQQVLAQNLVWFLEKRH